MRRLSFIAALFVSSLASHAHATAEFPTQIVNDLKITCANPIWDGNGCMICHTSNNGGLGSATQPFGVWMKSQGLTPFNDGKLSTLLTQLKNETAPNQLDSNCDGVADIDELTTCQWPNLAKAQTSCAGGDAGVPVNVFYGCSTSPTLAPPAQQSPAIPASVAVGLVALLAGALVLKRRKRA